MNMVLGNMPLDDLNLITFADLTDQLTDTFRNITTQNRLTILAYPDQVLFYVINGITRFTIMLHTASILKSSPKGEGFSPIPRMGH